MGRGGAKAERGYPSPTRGRTLSASNKLNTYNTQLNHQSWCTQILAVGRQQIQCVSI